MQLRKFSLIACLGAVLSLCCPTTKAEAILASVKSVGMAATAIAHPIDSLCAAYNPAGILYVGNRLDVGVGWLHNEGSGRISNNLAPIPGVNGTVNGMKREDYYFGDFGIANTWCCECFNWSLGLVAYNRNFQKTRYKKVNPLFGSSRPGLEYVHMTVAPTFAFELWECLAVGVSIDWQIQRIKVNGLENFDNPVFSLHPGHVTNRGYDYSHGVTATIGARLQIWDWLAIGATYQPKTHMGKLDKYKGFLVHGELDVPEKIGAGICITPLPCLFVCFDWEWIHWSNIPSFSNRLLHDNTLFLLGSEHGPGFGFKNQDYFRFGVEYQIDDSWTLRAGFRHANTPIRGSQTVVNLLSLDCVENFVTVGATYHYDCWNEFSGFFAYGFEHEVKGKNVIPLIPFGGGDVKLKENKYALGLSWGWMF